jgi:hypothetical protein
VHWHCSKKTLSPHLGQTRFRIDEPYYRNRATLREIRDLSGSNCAWQIEATGSGAVGYVRSFFLRSAPRPVLMRAHPSPQAPHVYLGEAPERPQTPRRSLSLACMHEPLDAAQQQQDKQNNNDEA